MIGKVTKGTEVGGLLRYLYGPCRANEHVDPIWSPSGTSRRTSSLISPPMAGGIFAA